MRGTKRNRKTYNKKKFRKNRRTSRKNSKKRRGGNKLNISEEMKQKLNPSKILLNYLNIICPQSHFCIAFGKENDKINAFFNHFINFEYISSPIKLLSKGASSSGFVNEIIFERDGYKASTILKSTVSLTADNLFYEAYIGYNYINPLNKYFPCFLETYGALKNTTTETKNGLWEQLQDKPIITDISPGYIQKALRPVKINDPKNIKLSCDLPLSNAVLIQYVENPMDMYDFFENNCNTEYGLCIEVAQLLFQVYAVLEAIKNEFTHYDLHNQNVLLYTIPDNKYVEMTYYSSNIMVKFKTRYIVKIIDYGRCYTPLSRKYIEQAFKNLDCKYGESRYKWVSDSLNEKNYYISTRINNPSHDLRLAKMLYDSYKDMNKNKNTDENDKLMGSRANGILSILENVKYDLMYGTPPCYKSVDPNQICNVSEMAVKLAEYIKTPYFQEMNRSLDTQFNVTKIGDMDIYLDRSKELSFRKIRTEEPILETDEIPGETIVFTPYRQTKLNTTKISSDDIPDETIVFQPKTKGIPPLPTRNNPYQKVVKNTAGIASEI